jgi:LysR family carnitine catabolism transcriptional activator
MNLASRDLRAVIALVEERNFTRAAERCHLSQSAFSTLIRTIEEGLGARLFDRSTRNVMLTAEGRIFEQSARRVLADFEEMVADFRDHAARRKGRVTIAALPSLASGWLPGVLAEFREACPGVELALFDLLSDQCLAMVRSGQADIAVASAGPDAADLRTELLFADKFHLVCPRSHPLVGKKTLRVKDLAAWPFVHLARTSSVRQHLEAAFHPTQMRTVLEVEHLATVTGLVEAGLGITVVPALTLFQFQRPGLVVRPLALPGLTRNIYLVKRSSESLSIAAQSLYGLLRQRRPKVTAAGPSPVAPRPPCLA